MWAALLLLRFFYLFLAQLVDWAGCFVRESCGSHARSRLFFLIFSLYVNAVLFNVYHAPGCVDFLAHFYKGRVESNVPMYCRLRHFFYFFNSSIELDHSHTGTRLRPDRPLVLQGCLSAMRPACTSICACLLYSQVQQGSVLYSSSRSHSLCHHHCHRRRYHHCTIACPGDFIYPAGHLPLCCEEAIQQNARTLGLS